MRRGETAYIFPYQKDADLFFNSSLVYELAVLKRCAEPLLYRISTEHSEYSEGRQPAQISLLLPGHSARLGARQLHPGEFIGASAFRY